MEKEALIELLRAVKTGDTSIEEAAETLEVLPYSDIGYATVDHQRQLRHGFPEVVFGPGKTIPQITGILEELRKGGGNILVTRVDDDTGARIARTVEGVVHHDEARALTLVQRPWEDLGIGRIAVVCAGTSDLPVAREAALTAELMGNRVDLVADVGVAGIHRILSKRSLLDNSTVIVVVAGMEGALASVVGGMVARPVIAVPTSVGYGASFFGLSALLTMLNSCASGVTVTNIDNGFGAGYAAALINRKRNRETDHGG